MILCLYFFFFWDVNWILFSNVFGTNTCATTSMRKFFLDRRPTSLNILLNYLGGVKRGIKDKFGCYAYILPNQHVIPKVRYLGLLHTEQLFSFRANLILIVSTIIKMQKCPLVVCVRVCIGLLIFFLVDRQGSI